MPISCTFASLEIKDAKTPFSATSRAAQGLRKFSIRPSAAARRGVPRSLVLQHRDTAVDGGVPNQEPDPELLRRVYGLPTEEREVVEALYIRLTNSVVY